MPPATPHRRSLSWPIRHRAAGSHSHPELLASRRQRRPRPQVAREPGLGLALVEPGLEPEPVALEPELALVAQEPARALVELGPVALAPAPVELGLAPVELGLAP